MRLVADLHIHSRYSLATSPKLLPTHLDRWARIKGIGLVGTGDCTHPSWLAELHEALEPAEEGFFRLKDEARREFDSGEALAEFLPEPGAAMARGPSGWAAQEPRFALTGEVCTIYKRDGKTRKVHHLAILPGFEAAAAFQARLEKLGHITSDGRPILGIDSRDLLALLLDADDRSILVPAHIWTPWFSALGGRSGFDSIDECYRDLSPRIGALETGLSSNPPMNWALSALDRFAIVSNSDAHSPEKLCREATILDMEMSYAGLADALSGASGGPRGRVLETIEFFPQEGKYHYDGHRSCKVVLDPEASVRAGGICPVCGKPLTPGVLSRVLELADREVDEDAPCPEDGSERGSNRRPYRSLIPLKELLAEILGLGVGSKKVEAAYAALVAKAESELDVLAGMSLPKLEGLRVHGVSGGLLAETIGRMRSGLVSITPGYDGEYGVIRAFAPGERFEGRHGDGLFEEEEGEKMEVAGECGKIGLSGQGRSRGKAKSAKAGKIAKRKAAPKKVENSDSHGSLVLDPAQELALAHTGGPALVVAGPGTGKTSVLTLRIERLIQEGLDPPSVLALTFTNKAAGELRERLAKRLGLERAEAITASTFHSFCRSFLRENAAAAGIPEDFTILDEEARAALIESMAGGRASAKRLGPYIEARKRFLLLPGETSLRLGSGAPGGLTAVAAALGLPDFDEELDLFYASYRAELRLSSALDFDDLVAGAVRLLTARPGVLKACLGRFRAVFVDEYQDLNFAQYALVRALAPEAWAELFVIGDPEQAIYGFRGADRRFTDRFLVDYPHARTYRLMRSFRCASSIADAASSLVATRLEGSGQAVALSREEYPTDKSEAEGIAREVDRLIGGTRFFARDSGVAGGEDGGVDSLADCAVLARAAALLEPIGKALLDHGIPFELVGEDTEAPYEIRSERLSLMTIHASKGLEFDYVFVAGLEEGILPFTLFDEGTESEELQSRIEEERRLLYVAMTRARKGLRLSWARTRSFKGRRLELEPSRFLAQIGGIVPLAVSGPRRPQGPQMELM
jgi:superfamily I DNA/RNA helicase/PHP family Zn ribbon phosphoesterase